MNSKTKGCVRRIPLPENVVCVLKQHALRQDEQNRDADTTRLGLDLVFPDGTGEELSVQRFLQEWSTFREHVELPRLRILVWRRLLAQERAAREGRDSTKDALNKSINGEEPHHG